MRSGVAGVMTTIGIIGSGMIGGTVARLSVAAGNQVVVSNSRGPETLAELAAELGPLAIAGTAEQAAEAGDLVLGQRPGQGVRRGSRPSRWPASRSWTPATTIRSATGTSPNSTPAR